MKKFMLVSISLVVIGTVAYGAGTNVGTNLIKSLLTSDAAIDALVSGFDGSGFDQFSCSHNRTHFASAFYDVRVNYYREALGPDYGRQIYDTAKNEYTPVLDEVLNRVRETLKDPEVVKELYLKSKDRLIKQIDRENKEDDFRIRLQVGLLVLQGRLTEKDLDVFKEYKAERDIKLAYTENMNYAEHDRLRCELERKLNEASTGIPLGYETFTIYEWMERRRSEGGDALVDAYAWAVHDLLTSL